MAGASAIGFGLGPEHATVPLELVHWCNGVGVPLLEASEDLSFSLVAQHVQACIEDADGSILRQQLVRTRRMLLRLSEGGGYKSLLDLIVRETGLDAAFVAARQDARRHAGGLAGSKRRAKGCGGRSARNAARMP